MNDLDAPATKLDLRDALRNHPTRDELHQALDVWAGALRAEMGQLRTELRGELRSEVGAVRLEIANVRLDIANAANVMIEEMRRAVGFVDDKYRDDPARLDALEGRVDSLEPRVTKLETAKRQRRR